MHPLPPPRPPQVPLASACGGKRTGDGTAHARPAVSRGWKIRSSPCATLLQRHQQQHRPQHQARKPQPAPDPQSGAGSLETGEAPTTAAATAIFTPGEESKVIKSKSKMGKSDKVIVPHSQIVYNVNKSEELSQSLSSTKPRNKRNAPLLRASKRSENSPGQNTACLERRNILRKEGKKNINPRNNCKTSVKLQEANLNSVLSPEGDQHYAGPKFSEPPSPSVLPKPPSHWVGPHTQYPDESKEIMTVHLKTLLRVNA
ncbi:proline-rich nuclear receptor coactivator 1 [Callorhinchus milii]|uniref:Proline-rich nuclear receptor coactivator 1 n=2 Tax=Callorhinchus milii TaxID=7868 RepID=V9KBL3_CALMI|nr:proline-rich nuclear receptor coactivator 1 [Callorhinchus milii]